MKIEEDGRQLVEFDYDRRSRISELKLPDGRVYRFEYDYDRADPKRVVRSVVIRPDRTVARFDVAQLNERKR